MTAKKTIKKQVARKAKANNNTTAPEGISHWLLVTAIKLSIIFVVTIGLYSIYLDGKVRQTFEGQRWQIPAQVYANVPVISISQTIDFTKIEKQLEHLNYQRVARVTSAGEYTRKSSKLIIYRREFDFGFGLQQPSLITIEEKSGEVYRLNQDNETTHVVKLEPILIDRILSADSEDRVFLSLDKVPEQLIDTLLLIEDKDFYSHHGISPSGLLRAFWKNLRAGARVQGGSTLTQQLAKNMYLNRDKTLWRKVNEAIIAVLLENRYSKDQLMEAYINEVYLGQHYANGIYGFGLAAQFYFGKPINELDSAQVALMIALVKGPSYYDPWRKPERAFERRDLVLRVMFESHTLNKEQYQSAIKQPLNIRSERRFAKQSYPAYMQLVRRELRAIGAGNAFQSGIKIFTGFDLHHQQHAEQALIEQLATLEQGKDSNDLEAGMVVSDISNGQIQAVVGGKAVKYSGFNRALDAQRPIGSLIKPAVYLTALERFEQYNLATPLADKPISLKSSKGKQWQPKNYDDKFRGQVPLIDGLVKSLNIPTVNLGLKLGLNQVANTLQALGYQKDVKLVPSMLLGAINMSPFEVNQWYNTIANGGIYNKPLAINLVLSAQGEVLWQRDQRVDSRLSAQGAYLIDYALRQVTVDGTAQSLSWKFPGQSLAGKTGTSNDLRDSWFVGFDQQSVATIWIGRDDNKPTGLTGSSGALTVFANYLSRQGSNSRFDFIPEGIEFATFELATGNAVTDECAKVADYPAIAAGIFYSTECLEKKKEPPSWLEKLFGSN